MNTKVAPTAPFHFQLAQRLNKTGLVQVTGPLKWGITRSSLADFWQSKQGTVAGGSLWQNRNLQTNKVQTNMEPPFAPKGRDHLALARTFADPTSPAPGPSIATELCQLTIDTALQDESLASGIPVDVIRKAVRDFNLVRFVQSIHASTSNPTARLRKLVSMEVPAWNVMLRLLSMCNAPDLLKCINLGSPIPSTHMPHLQHMATALLELRMQGSDWVGPTNAICVDAVAHGLAQVAGQSAEAAHTAWAFNAFRNGLRSTEPGSAFMAIDARLCKLGVWLRRNHQQAWHHRLLPLWHKNPFRSLRLGLMGADLGDWKDGRLSRRAKIAKRALPSQIAEHLNHLIDHIQGASRLRILSGGVAGLGTKGISSTLTSVFLGLLARFKLDLRWMKLRLAGLDIAMPPYNLEMTIFSSRGVQTQLGAGVAVGPGIGPLEITVGGSIKALCTDQREDSGIVLRMPRERGKEQHLRQQFKAMLNDLIILAPNSKQDGSLLKTLLQRHPTLSVNTIERAGEYKRTHGANLEINAGINLGVAKLAAHGELGANLHAKVTRHHKDCGGAIQVNRHLLGRRLNIGVEGRLEARFEGLSDPFRLNMLTIDGLGGSVEIATAGRHVKRDVVYVEGKISPLSYYEVEYQSFDDFRKAIMSRLPEWSISKAMQSNTSVESAKAEILAFLQQASERLMPQHSFAARCELRQTVAQEIDALHSLIALHSAHGNPARQLLAEKLQALIQTKLDCPDSYQETSFRAYDRADKTHTRGLHAALRLEQIHQAEGVHAHTRLM
ncbi:MAG TPA: hypothetical protein VFV57_04260 [Limnobacter sp.]|nr:hypothetical protein [Limnobacter sp.]